MNFLDTGIGRALRQWTFLWLGIETSLAGACIALAQDAPSPAGGEVSVERPCRILVRDAESGWPVPLVELRTVNQLRFVSDNAGVVAFDAPELMNREVWFFVIGHGYEVPPDGFGYRGVRLTPQPGETLTVQVRRTSIARRVGRLTGSGLFAESRRFGEHVGLGESPILGCDSVQTATYRGRIFWAWGDTNVARYPLGNFHMTGATTGREPFQSFQPPLTPAFDYFLTEHQQPKGIAPLAGMGPTWLTGFMALPDQHGSERLVAFYRKIKPPLETYECGLCVWHDDREVFEPLAKIWQQTGDEPEPKRIPIGHPVRWEDEAGRVWILFGDPLPSMRCPATFEAWQDPTTWETVPRPRTFQSAGDGQPVQPHSGSIAWNAFRQRWVTVFMQAFGKPSAFGELWYAEATSPLGPWGPAVKVLSHENYTFYNPQLHPELTPDDSPILLLEGTYTQQFADHPFPTPRYDYNQILYRLDLDDPGLAAARGPTPP